MFDSHPVHQMSIVVRILGNKHGSIIATKKLSNPSYKDPNRTMNHKHEHKHHNNEAIILNLYAIVDSYPLIFSIFPFLFSNL